MKGFLSLGCVLLLLNGAYAKDSYLKIKYSPKTPAVRTGVLLPETKKECLNGRWDFLPIKGDEDFQKTLEVFREFKEYKTTPGKDAEWEEILVPSMWGYYWGRAFLDKNGKTYNDKWGNKVKRAWYRHKFKIPENWDKNKRTKIKFDAAAGFTRVFVNGLEVGEHNGSLFSFEFDITDKLKPGEENELLVYSVMRFRARKGELAFELPEGRQNQYGIYRNVWLKNESGVTVENPQIITSVRKKKIDIAFDISNKTDATKKLELVVDIIKPDGKTAKKIGEKKLSLEKGKSKKESFESSWKNPELWDVDKPNLYFARIRISENGKLIYERQQRFGFREFWIEGPFFYLNGKKITLRGDWIHTVWYGDPAKMYPDYMKILIKQMKSLNFQGPRFSAAASPEWLLDLLDEAGIPVIATGITPNYYGDPHPEFLELIKDKTKEWIRRDRNHPSIILWSTMNEATANSKFHPRYKWQKKLIDIIAQEDPTRPQYNDGHAENNKAEDFFTTGNLAGDLPISCGHYGNLKSCPNDYIGFFNAPKYWPRKRPFIDGEEGVFGPRPLFYPRLAVRTAGIKGLFYNIEKRRELSGRWLKLMAHAWRAWEIPGFMGFNSFEASWENPFPVIKKNYDRQYHKVVYLDYDKINSPGPKGQLVIGHERDDDPRANPWTTEYPETQTTSHAKYTKAAYAPAFATITRNWQANYFSGSELNKKIDIVNDLREDAKNLTLTWNLYDKKKKIAGKTFNIDVPQGKLIQKEISLNIPETKVLKKFDLNVLLKDKNGNELSSETLEINAYPKPDFASLSSKKIMIYDPIGDTSNKLSKSGAKVSMFDISKLNPKDTSLLLIGREAFSKSSGEMRQAVQNYINEGGNVFLFRQKTKKKTSACLIDKSAPQSPVFQDLKEGIISNWKLEPDSELLKFPLNWPTSGRFNMLALIGAESAGRHELALMENYIGKGRLIACNMELTDSIPQEPEAMILLKNIFEQYSQPSKYATGKTVYISAPGKDLLMKEPFWIDAKYFSSGFENIDLAGVNTVIIGDIDKLDIKSLKAVKEKLKGFKGNVLILPQKDNSFINTLIGEESKIKLRQLKTRPGARKNVAGIVGFLNKGEDPASQGLDSFFQTCMHKNIGMPTDTVSKLFENPEGWISLLAPYDRLPGKNRGEFGVVPIKDEVLIRKNIDGKNFILSNLLLPNRNPAINRIYLTLLTNLGVGEKTATKTKEFSLSRKDKNDWSVNSNGIIYEVKDASQIGAVKLSPDAGALKVGTLKSSGISLIRSGYMGLKAPFLRFTPGLARHPGDLGKARISAEKKDKIINFSRRGIMRDPLTRAKMDYDSRIDFRKDGEAQFTYDFKVLEGSNDKYRPFHTILRLDMNEEWTGKNVNVKMLDGKDMLFKWPAPGMKLHKRIKTPKELVFESANGIKWKLAPEKGYEYLIFKRAYHKGFEITLESGLKKIALKKGEAFSYGFKISPIISQRLEKPNIFNAISKKSVYPIVRFEKNSPDAQRYFFVNIVKKCNAPFSGQKWTDKLSSTFRLDQLNGGDFYLNGTPFHIINADTDELEGGDAGLAMSMIIMRGEHRPDFLEKVKNIQVGEKAKSLFFLQSAVYVNSPSGKWDKKENLEMWKYKINYADGTSATIPVTNHINVKDWYNQNTSLPGAKIAYVEKKVRQTPFAVWSQEWRNPEPDKVISSIEIESAGKGIPVILAITGKK